MVSSTPYRSVGLNWKWVSFYSHRNLLERFRNSDHSSCRFLSNYIDFVNIVRGFLVSWNTLTVDFDQFLELFRNILVIKFWVLALKTTG